MSTRSFKTLMKSIQDKKSIKNLHVPSPAERKEMETKKDEPVDKTKQTNEEMTLDEKLIENASRHKVNVTVSDPYRTAVSKRKEKIQKFVNVVATSKEDAVDRAKAFYKKKGYRIHDAEYHSMVESVTLAESKMSDLHLSIGQHMDTHIAAYKTRGGAEHLMSKAEGAAKKISKSHGLSHDHALKFVSSYIDSKLNSNNESVSYALSVANSNAEFKHAPKPSTNEETRFNKKQKFKVSYWYKGYGAEKEDKSQLVHSIFTSDNEKSVYSYLDGKGHVVDTFKKVNEETLDESRTPAPSNAHGATKLFQHGVNDESHYKNADYIIKNLSKKHDKGIYDHEKATSLWTYHADKVAKDFSNKFGGSFTPATRREAAKMFRDHYDSHVRGDVNEETQLDEVSGGLLGRYIQAARKEILSKRDHANALESDPKVVALKAKRSELYNRREYTRSGESKHRKAIDKASENIEKRKEKLDPNYPKSVLDWKRRRGVAKAIEKLSTGKLSETFDKYKVGDSVAIEETLLNKIADTLIGAAPRVPKYKVGQHVTYQTNPHQPNWKDGGTGHGKITDYKNGHYIINGNPVNHFEIKKIIEDVEVTGETLSETTLDRKTVGKHTVELHTLVDGSRAIFHKGSGRILYSHPNASNVMSKWKSLDKKG